MLSISFWMWRHLRIFCETSIRSNSIFFNFFLLKGNDTFDPPPSGYVHLSHVLTTSGATLSGKSVGSHPPFSNAAILFQFMDNHIYCILALWCFIVNYFQLRHDMKRYLASACHKIVQKSFISKTDCTNLKNITQ